jgi:hypothetical protein
LKTGDEGIVRRLKINCVAEQTSGMIVEHESAAYSISGCLILHGKQLPKNAINVVWHLRQGRDSCISIRSASKTGD